MKVLVTANFSEEGIRRLAELGMEVIYDPWSTRGKLLMSDELAERIQGSGAEAVIIEVDLCHEEVFESCSLRFVGCCRGDPLNVDVDEATEKGVPVFYAPGRNADAVADLAVALMLCHLRKLPQILSMIKSGEFDPQTPTEFMELLKQMTGYELSGMTVGIVGMGAVGCAVARRLKGFGSSMLSYDPFVPEGVCEELGASSVSLEDLFKESDIVTLHAAAKDETEGMITAELINSMKRDALFVNLARAELVDNQALIQALENNRIQAAAVDVFMSEPPQKDDPFMQLENVIATPHIGGATFDVIRHQTDIVLADIEAYLAGKEPRHCANPQVLGER